MLVSSTQPCLVASLLPKKIFNSMVEGKYTESAMLALATLAVNTALGTLKALQNGTLKSLDPNPGDAACQLRAFLILGMVRKGNVLQEAKRLADPLKDAKSSLNLRASRATKFNTKGSPLCFEQITVSKEMAFLLRCHILAITRQAYERLSTGVVLTRTHVSLLSKLSNKISCLFLEDRNLIIETLQKKLSASSLSFIRKEAEKITSLEEESKRHLTYMLSNEMTKIFTPDPLYLPKTFGCQFYEFKAVLYRLREDQEMVCFKSIVPPGPQQPFYLFFKPEAPGRDFTLTCCSSNETVVVIEGVTPLCSEEFARAVADYGFTELMLASASQADPYERKSKLEDVPNEAAKVEIQRYRENNVTSILELDHLYCNTVKAEGVQYAKAT